MIKRLNFNQDTEIEETDSNTQQQHDCCKHVSANHRRDGVAPKRKYCVGCCKSSKQATDQHKDRVDLVHWRENAVQQSNRTNDRCTAFVKNRSPVSRLGIGAFLLVCIW